VAITYVASTSFAEGDTGTNIAAVAKPAGVALNDVLISGCYSENTGATPLPASTGDIWVEVHVIDNTTPTPDFRFAVHYCVVGNTSSTVSYTGTNIGWRDTALHCFRGVDTTTPLDVAATENQGSSTTVTGLGVASGTAARWLVLMVANFQGDTLASWTSPLVERNDSGNVAMAAGEDTAGTDTANKTAAVSPTAQWTAIMLALRPAGGAAVSPIYIPTYHQTRQILARGY
jgi:hypothetical protein